MPKYGLNKFSRFKYGRYTYEGDGGALLKTSRFKVRSISNRSVSMFLVESEPVRTRIGSFRLNQTMQSRTYKVPGRIRRTRLTSVSGKEKITTITDTYTITRREKKDG